MKQEWLHTVKNCFKVVRLKTGANEGFFRFFAFSSWKMLENRTGYWLTVFLSDTVSSSQLLFLNNTLYLTPIHLSYFLFSIWWGGHGFQGKAEKEGDCPWGKNWNDQGGLPNEGKRERKREAVEEKSQWPVRCEGTKKKTKRYDGEHSDSHQSPRWIRLGVSYLLLQLQTAIRQPS